MTLMSEHQLLVFWVQILTLLTAARLLGGLMRRLGQPAVAGELAAGLVVGPSLLGRVAPEVHGWLFPVDPMQSGALLSVAWIGVALLLLITGFETDLNLLAHLGRSTLAVSIGSLVVPLAFGFGVGWVVPALFIGEAGTREIFALFFAVALGVSALPVIAKILIDLGLMRRNIGQVTVAAGMANDLVGWLLLGVIAGLVTGRGLDLVNLVTTVAAIAAFLVLALTVGQRMVDRALRIARQGEAGLIRSFSVVVGVMLVAAVVTQAIGVEAVLGAFIAGIVVGRSRYHRAEVTHSLDTVTTAVFAPLFFATAGLHVDLGLLADPVVLTWALVVIAAAAASKLIGSYAGGRLGGLGARESLAVGVGLNARGALEIVVATIGLGLGVLNVSSYTVVVVMAIVTSMMTPPLLRLVLRTIVAAPEEEARLRHEELLSSSVVASTRSALLPTRGGVNSVVAGRLLDLSLQPGTDVTILTVHGAPPGTDRRDAAEAAREVARALGERTVRHLDRNEPDPARAVLAEASLGYGLLAVGMTERYLGGQYASPIIQTLLTESPIPLLLVKAGRGLDPLAAQLGIRRILVPAIGTLDGQAAQEIAFTLAARVEAEAHAIHVVTRPDADRLAAPAAQGELHPGTATAGSRGIAGVLAEAVLRAERFGGRVATSTRSGPVVGVELTAAAEEIDADLIVLGARVRAYDGRPFMGHGVEYLLEHAPQTVVVVVFPTAKP